MHSFFEGEGDSETVSTLRSCFAAIHALDGEERQRYVDLAVANPADYVLKPQREGGGNNLYADEMVAALKRMNEREQAAYVLMGMIVPTPFSTAILRSSVDRPLISSVPCISELGIYSTYIR
jgi:glutathione synthase